MRRLGLLNLTRVGSYRFGVKLGLNSVRRLQASSPTGPFFLPAVSVGVVGVSVPDAWQTSARLFGHWPFPVSDTPPDWLANPFTCRRVKAPQRGWWEIPDFDPEVGDIKLIWELSRLDWVLAFAQQVRQGDVGALARLNDWLLDWCVQNPPYRGPNWKCGQESSIRVMHLAMAALILGQVRDPTPGLRNLVLLHLQRIAPTVHYAVGQDNNHGSSEAAALFIGGSWLSLLGVHEGERWQRVGRRWLENRAVRLIGPSGSFSQYSLNYHRVALDTFSMAELWRSHLELPIFSEALRERVPAAAQWLRHMVDPNHGDGPNVGANDGARLLQLTDTPYRDHRPSVQLAMALFVGQRAYAGDGTWNGPLHWLGIPLPQSSAPAPRDWLADDGGFAMLRRGRWMAMLRYPRFVFRPSQADALHLDLWVNGVNVLRDGGTYSYNTEPSWLAYFGGTASHNTVQLDERDQMPRLSRFLLGEWLQTRDWQPPTEMDGVIELTAGYRDWRGGTHLRRLQLEESWLRIEDTAGGFARNAVLRWRLVPGIWQLRQEGAGWMLRNSENGMQLHIEASVPITRCELVGGWESRHYLEKTEVPVLEVEIRRPGTFTTEISGFA